MAKPPAAVCPNCSVTLQPGWPPGTLYCRFCGYETSSGPAAAPTFQPPLTPPPDHPVTVLDRASLELTIAGLRDKLNELQLELGRAENEARLAASSRQSVVVRTLSGAALSSLICLGFALFFVFPQWAPALPLGLNVWVRPVAGIFAVLELVIAIRGWSDLFKAIAGAGSEQKKVTMIRDQIGVKSTLLEKYQKQLHSA